MATNAFPYDLTVRQAILDYLDADPLRNPMTPLPCTFMGLPVCVSNLDAMIKDCVVK